MATIFAPSARDLVEIEELADRLGVFLELHLDKDEDSNNFIWLGAIERTCGKPGAGGETIKRLTEYADEYELPIRGAVLCWNSDLLAYYSEHGFQVIQEGQADTRHDHSIIERIAQ
jgi:hypothetical protein